MPAVFTASPRRLLFRVVIIVFVLCAGLNPGYTSEAAESAGSKPAGADRSRSNVIWILLDTCRAMNLGSYGYNRPTSPNIDKLAANGVLMERNYAQAGHSFLSVPSLLKGRYFPASCLNVQSPYIRWRQPAEDELDVAAIMARNGYATYAVSAHPWVSPPCHFWDSFDDGAFLEPAPGAAYANLGDLREAAVDWIDRHRESPFFIYLHSMDVHFPHVATGKPYDQWLDPDFPNKEIHKAAKPYAPFDEAEQKYIRGLYDGSILYADTMIGELIDDLRARDLFDNTVIVISSDHGEALGEDGTKVGHSDYNLEDEGIHVPLIFSGPGVPAGVRLGSDSENVDILPTLVDLLGLETEATFDGSSLVPHWRREQDAHRDRDYVVIKRRLWQDNKPDYGVILRDDRVKFDLTTGRAWKTPDHFGQRVDVTAETAGHCDALRAAADRDLSSLWSRWRGLPLTLPAPFESTFSASHVDDPSVFSTTKSSDDNLWYLEPTYLSCVPWREQPPPISFSIPVPNATYRVRLRMLSREDFQGHAGASFRVKAESDSGFRPLRADIENHPGWDPALIGEYTVDDGLFNVTLAYGADDEWAIATRMLFEPVTEDQPSARDPMAEEKQEQLRALGYIE